MGNICDKCMQNIEYQLFVSCIGEYCMVISVVFDVSFDSLPMRGIALLLRVVIWLKILIFNMLNI